MPIWDPTIGKETRRLAPQGGSPAQVAFAPNAFCLLPSAFCLPPSACGHVQRITALAFSTDSRYLVSGSQDTSALVWDLAEVGK